MTPAEELAQFERQARKAFATAEHTQHLETLALRAGYLPGVANQLAAHAITLARNADITPEEALHAYMKAHNAKNAAQPTKPRRPTLRAKLTQNLRRLTRK